MKKLFTVLIVLVLAFQGFSQTTYSVDFTAVTSFPTGFVTWNKDGQSVNSQLTQIIPALSSSNGWVLDNTQDFFQGDIALCGTYFGNSATPSDRWLVSPRITIPTGQPNIGLVWSMYPLGPDVGVGEADNYQVLVSTTDSNTTSFTSNLLTVIQETGATHALPLAAFAGQTIRIAFRDTTVNGIGLIFPGFKVINLPAAAITVNDVEIYEHNYLNNPVQVTGLFTNNGLDTINDFVLNYSVNGGTVQTDTVTNAGLVSQQEYFYFHNIPFNPTTAGTYTIKVWFSGLNNSAASSDTSSTTVFFYPQVSGLVKNVLVEELTGVGCPWCSGGALVLRDDYHNHPDYVIPVAIHSADINDLQVSPADALQIANGEDVVNALGQVNEGGFPTAMVDRQFYFDNQTVTIGVFSATGGSNTYQGPDTIYTWDTLSVFRKAMATPANVSLTNISYDSTMATNNLSVTVNASFLQSLSQGTYNLNLYVVEDSVLRPTTGDTSGHGYDQNNTNYSNQSSSGNSELYYLPTVVRDDGQPNDWAQNHVLRLMAGGAWGTTGKIPSAPVAGTTYSNTYTATIPSSWRNNYLYLVGLVQEYNSDVTKRIVLNAVRTKLVGYPAGIVETTEFNKLSVYPNPASTTATVMMDIKENAMVNISLVNTLGEVVSQPTDVLLNAGTHTVNIPVGGLDNGLYFVKITANGEVSTLPLSVTSK